MRPLKKKVSITLDEEIIEGIKILSEQYQRSFSQYINIILGDHLQRRAAKNAQNKTEK